MRFLISSIVFCCCFVATSYAQDATDESPAEVVVVDDGAGDVAASDVDSLHGGDKSGGCGCGGKPKI